MDHAAAPYEYPEDKTLPFGEWCLAASDLFLIHSTASHRKAGPGQANWTISDNNEPNQKMDAHRKLAGGFQPAELAPKNPDYSDSHHRARIRPVPRWWACQK